MLRKALTVKALATFGVLALGSVSAAAATGTLPTAAQDGLANAASHVGVTLPASHDSHPSKDSHPGAKPESDAGAESDATADVTPATPNTHDNHGAVVSETAHTTDATGRDKGAEISAVARGDHGPPTSTGKPDVTTPNTSAAVPTPNAGGIGTGSTASDDANSTGVDHSAPQAADGSANAGDHPHQP
jgi:hypothetical protein